jgi:hypothetical protein
LAQQCNTGFGCADAPPKPAAGHARN